MIETKQRLRRFGGYWLLVFASVSAAMPLSAAEVRVAVAANFASTLRAVAQAFEAASGHKVTIITGSSGKIYAQITQGAPFDVFLSADQAKPAALVDKGLALADSRFTYAEGVLVLWRASDGQISAQTLHDTQAYRHLAIANPKLAPYGVAAKALLNALDVRADVAAEIATKLVQGENVQQAFQFVASGNAELGLVALSQFYDYKNKLSRVDADVGEIWRVPATDYPAIRQDAVLLKRAADNPAAHALLQYLRSDAALGVIRERGYTH